MKKELKDFIRLQLFLYHQNKEMLTDNTLKSLVDRNYLGMITHLVSSIERVLCMLPEEIKLYTRMRYFEQHVYKRSAIALAFRVSERTINRWDRKLLRCIALHMGIFKNEA